MDIEDKNKGIDEIIEVIGDLKKKVDNLLYIIIGDGNDKDRLEKKAKFLNVSDSIIFLGNVEEKIKIDFYMLGHIMAMPGSRKSFDRYPFRFVNLEALSSGMHVLCSKVNYKSEMNYPNVKMLNQVNPNDKKELINEIIKLFKKKKKTNSLIKNFYFNNFKRRLKNIINIIDDNTNIKKN